MAKFYKQPEGLLIPPAGFDKFHVSWTENNIVEGFKHFFDVHGRYPMSEDLDNCGYLPNVKTIQRNFGGITKIRELLGLEDLDLRKGAHRSSLAHKVGRRGFDAEEELYKILVDKFGEFFVHTQSRVVGGDRKLNVDFIVYHKTGKFAVDIFYPNKSRLHFSNNVTIKYKTYTNFQYRVFLVVANNEITDEMVADNSKRAIHTRNNNATLITLNSFLVKLGEYEKLPDPYKER